MVWGIKSGACLLFVVLHVVTIRLSHGHDSAASYAFLITVPWIGIVACLRFAARAQAAVATAWRLFAGGLAIWACGIVVAAWSDLVQGASPLIANATDFFYFYSPIGIILALGLPDSGALTRRVFWIDALQAALAGYLAYVAIFDVVPFTGVPARPIPESLQVATYNIEDGALIAMAALRVLGRSADPERRCFDRSALWFLACYGGCAALYNAWVMSASFAPGPAAVLTDIPFLLLALLPAGPKRTLAGDAERHGLLTALIDGATPTFFTLALLSLSFSIARRHFALGTLAMIAAMILYASRAALLQVHHLRTRDALAAARDRLLHLSLLDDLTGIPNRRAFGLAIETLWPRRHAAEAPLCLLLIDIDHFKSINDVLGHRAGDECLAHIAAALRGALPGLDDQLFRYGGEEFAVLLPDRTAGRACLVAETLLAAVRQVPIAERPGYPPHVTISIGVAETSQGVPTPAALMSDADRALYMAKDAGRDRLALLEAQVCAPDPLAAPLAAGLL